MVEQIRQGDNIMKKLIALMLTVALSVACFVSITACDKNAYKAVKLESVSAESYGFAVKKGQNANILAACNTVIGKSDFKTKVDELVIYYTAIYGGETPKNLSFSLPDLSDNTAGTLKVGTEAGFAPFEFSDNGGINGVAGLDVAIMMMVAEELNYKLEIVDMNFKSLPAALTGANPTIDIIAAGFTIDDERAKTMDFSDNYFTSTQYIVCASDKSYSKIEDLKGLKIAVQTGTTGDFMVADAIDLEEGELYGSNAECIGYDSITLAMQDLKKGSIDCIIVDELPAKSLIAANK